MTLVIAWAFTLASLLALLRHGQYLRRRVLQRRAYVASGENGQGLKIANALVRSEAARGAINLVVFLVGAGYIAGFRPTGWLLILIPIISLTASQFALEA